MICPDYDVTTDLLAYLCKEVYELKHDIGEQIAKYLVIDILDDECTGTYSLLLESEDSIVVVTRGTQFTTKNLVDAATDIKTNINFETLNIPTKYGYARIHSGYYYAAMKLAQFNDKIFNIIKRNDKPIYVTGHSLGGAVSTFYAVRLKENYEDVMLVTFGAPKVCNKAYRKIFADLELETYRVINHADMIPQLYFFLDHPCDHVMLTSEGIKTGKDSFWSAIWRFTKRLLGSAKYKNRGHDIISYIDETEKFRIILN